MTASCPLRPFPDVFRMRNRPLDVLSNMVVHLLDMLSRMQDPSRADNNPFVTDFPSRATSDPAGGFGCSPTVPGFAAAAGNFSKT